MVGFRTFLLGIFAGMAAEAFFYAFFEKEARLQRAKYAFREVYNAEDELYLAAEALDRCRETVEKVALLNDQYSFYCARKNRRTIR